MVEISFFSFSFFFRGGEREREEEIGREKQKKLSLWTSALDFRSFYVLLVSACDSYSHLM